MELPVSFEDALKAMRKGLIVQSVNFACRRYKLGWIGNHFHLFVEIDGIWEQSLNKVIDFIHQQFIITEQIVKKKKRRTRKELLEEHYTILKNIKKKRRQLDAQKRRADKLYNLALTRL